MPTREEKALLTRLQRIAKYAEESIEYLTKSAEEPEEAEEYHAEYDKDEKGFVCLIGRKKACKEMVYDAPEIISHLRTEHGIKPDKALIDGWTSRHDKQLEKSKETDEEEDEEEEDEEGPYTAKELKGYSSEELGEILDDMKVKYPRKAKSSELVKLILDSQEEEEEEEEDEGEEDEEAEEEEEKFQPFDAKSKDVKAFQKDFSFKKDDMAVIIEYANDEHLTLEDAARELDMLEEAEEEEDEEEEEEDEE